MLIDENTKVILRLHREANNRGLNIYNPFFQQSGLNAIYLLRHNPSPRSLVDGMRNLNITGAIPAGFEKSSDFVDLLDDLTPEAEHLGRVGLVKNVNGKLLGHYQGGIGLYNSIITRFGALTDQRIVLFGAGTVARGLLFQIRKHGVDCKVTLVNRNTERLEQLASEFSDIVVEARGITELAGLVGDVFIDTTDIGSPWNKGDNYEYTEEFVGGFKFVADVTFVPKMPQLIETAKKKGLKNAPGHRMFLYQAQECLRFMLGERDYDLDLFEEIMLKDFEVNWS